MVVVADLEKNQKTQKIRKVQNRSKKKTHQDIAKNRISILFSEAEKLFLLQPGYANNCVGLARAISLRYKVPFTKEQKLMFCKNCKAYLKPTVTARIRVQRGKIVVLCLTCKHIKRMMYK